MILYLYDESGRLLGEYEPPKTGTNAQVIREYVYADGLPLAILDPVPIGGSVHYIHVDHLGTPRAVMGDDKTWRWEWRFQGNPFGEQPPNEDPENTGAAFTLNLRFPGQYYDAESGLHYNYFRDYEPGTGRYVQSDPIGLEGGLSTYSYASSDPLGLSDLMGLFGSGQGYCIAFGQCPRPRVPPPPPGPRWGFGPDCGSPSDGSDRKVPDNPFSFKFQECCQKHDKCYEDFNGPSRARCDGDFCSCLRSKCRGYQLVQGVWVLCRSSAGLYCTTVKWKGGKPYNEARKDCCE